MNKKGPPSGALRGHRFHTTKQNPSGKLGMQSIHISEPMTGTNEMPSKPPKSASNNQDQKRKMTLDPQDPYRSAEKLVDYLFRSGGFRTLHYHRGQFWYLRDGCYQGLDMDEVKNAIWTFLNDALMMTEKGHQDFKPKTDSVNNVFGALKSVCEVASQCEPPAWLRHYNDQPGASADQLALHPRDLLIVGNGILHVPTSSLYAPSPALFVQSASSVRFDRTAERPRQWHKFLDQVLDKEAQRTLQTWFGYNLTPDTSLQKIMALIGPPRSGKGTIGRVMRAKLGERSVGSVTLASLSSDFGLQQLIGKPSCLIPDARFGKKSDPAAVAERLLSISGEDAIVIARKFLGDYVGQLPTRFTLMTNELPYVLDSSGAVVNRFIILTMQQSFLGKEDPTLFERLLVELPGILNWSIEGFHMLRDEGRFVQPVSSADTIEEMAALSSPVMDFVGEMCDLDPEWSVDKRELFISWGNWCTAQGRSQGTAPIFSRDLKAAFPQIGTARPRVGDRKRVYTGIRLVERQAPVGPRSATYVSAHGAGRGK